MPQKIVIIGAGPAGEAAAITLKKINRDCEVLLIEKEYAGGLCLNKGCVPSKTLLEHIHTRSKTGNQSIPWPEIQKKKQAVILEIRGQLEGKFKALKIHRIQGTARFDSASSVTVESNGKTETYNFDKAILAAGTDVYYPRVLEPHRKDVLTSDTILEITQTPKSVVIVGGGAVGCEFACLLQAAGSKVTLVEMKETLIPGEDPAVAGALASVLESRGVVVKTSATLDVVKKTPAGWQLEFSSGETIQAMQLLSCVGRSPSVQGLALDKAGIKVDKNRLVIDENLRTTNANVFAAGDIAGSRLAHHAAAQGEVAAANALGDNRICDDRFVPRCLYTWPEVASVGAWKYQLEEAGKPVKASRAFFKASAKALAAEQPEGFVQIVSDPETGMILGAQIIGAHATEMIHIFSVALKAEMKLTDLAGVMFAHPTLSELIREAARK
jgi:dihydrolipoamide dehydrogenase